MSDTNSGNYNSGDYNSGNRNSGFCNSGDYNSGNYNSGNRNSGDYNSGEYNSGNRNSGNYNSGNYNSGDCNTNAPTVRIFNKDSGLEYFGETHVRFRSIIEKYSKPLCEWISTTSMSEKEKSDNPSFKTTMGYLKVNTDTRNDIELTGKDIKFLKSIPNFDADILLQTTGIDINGQKKKIVIDGKEILISKESFEEMKRQFLE